MKLATLSFDDGGASDLGLVRYLEGVGIRATFYIVSGMLAPDGFWHWWRMPDEIRDLYRDHEIGSHSMRHPAMEKLPRADWDSEIAQSRSILRQFFGQEVACFAWPFNAWTAGQERVLDGAGYSWGRSYWPRPQEVLAPKSRWFIPISARLHSTFDDEVHRLIEADAPAIHIAGHAHHMTYALWQIFDAAVANLMRAGYKFVPNSEFFGETYRAKP